MVRISRVSRVSLRQGSSQDFYCGGGGEGRLKPPRRRDQEPKVPRE